jgi:hypothetical protein
MIYPAMIESQMCAGTASLTCAAVVRVGEKVLLGFREKPRRQTSPGRQISWEKVSTASHTEDKLLRVMCIVEMKIGFWRFFSWTNHRDCLVCRVGPHWRIAERRDIPTDRLA